MRLLLLSLLAALAPYTLADVQITSPAAGESIPAGSVTVKWEDTGEAPTLAQLGSYTLSLVVGGDDESDALQLATLGAGSFTTENSATGTIDPSLASSLKNGFYLKMMSTAKDGGTVTNYSNRFTITGLTGTIPRQYTDAVAKLGGKSTGPEARNAVRNAAVPPPAAGAPGAVGAAPAPTAVPPAAVPAEFDVPYNLQTGLTKYAPMQPQPGTKITQDKATPLYPTSAFNIAVKPLPVATVLTTVTEPPTEKVQSMENTVSFHVFCYV